MVFFRWDLTNEKRYTLRPQTKKLMEESPQEITITLFLEGDMPAAFKRLRLATQELLQDYRAYAPSRLKILYENPLEGRSLDEQELVLGELAQIGIHPTTVHIRNDIGLSQKLIFPMVLIETGDRSMAVNLLSKSGGPASGYDENINGSIQNLEYTFTSAIRSLIHGSSPAIGFTEGNGEPDNVYFYDAITTLSQRFYVGRVDLKLIQKEGLDSMKVLFVAKPTQALSELEKFKINYFVMKGGKVVWLIDQVNVGWENLEAGKPYVATNRDLNVDDMLFEYGARLNYNLLADLHSALIPVASGNRGDEQIELAPWPYDPVLQPDSSHLLVRNIDGVRGHFLGTVDTIPVKGIQKQYLLRSSPYHQVYQTPAMISLQAVGDELKTELTHEKAARGVALLLEGRFKSVFQYRAVPEGIMEAYPAPERSEPTAMVVIGDGDLFSNQFDQVSQNPFPLGYDRYSQQQYGNKTFLMNLADYLTGGEELMELRQKEIPLRLLDKVKIKNEKWKWQWINTGIPLALLVFFAIFQHYYRKHKYAK